MKKLIFGGFLFIVLMISACSHSNHNDMKGGLSGDKPPNVFIEIDGVPYETTHGSYCWDDSKGTAECVDTVGPIDLLKGKEPVEVAAGEKIKLTMDYMPHPNQVHLSQVTNDNEEEIEIRHHQFIAPDEAGTYYYSYGVWWMDEEIEHLAHGSASYVFSLKVQ